MTIYWRLHHEVYPELPPEQDFIALDEGHEKSIGRVYIEKHGVYRDLWKWSMVAHSHTGRVPFETYGHEDSRGDAGRRVVEAYRKLLAHNEQHPRKAPRGLEGPAGQGLVLDGPDTQRGPEPLIRRRRLRTRWRRRGTRL